MDSHTLMFGVIGDPIRHSKSPVMLNRAFREIGINGAYAAFHVVPERLEQAIAGVRGLGFRGLNVTIPHKVEVMKYLDEISEGARAAGAVNTIVNENGRLIGYNTDGIGYVRSLKEEAEPELSGKTIVVLGAGGAARGILWALAQEGPAAVFVANRTEARAAELAASFPAELGISAVPWSGLRSVAAEADVVINTTSVGMSPNVDELPMDPSWMKPGAVASDLIYNPLKTAFLSGAEERGCRIHGGLGMFIYQGAYAFEYWTGQPAPVAAMREVVLASFTIRQAGQS
ncbi:shikimate dehydrogenase [Cohnella sp. CIP 111063]|uniref:shikimate dehydrogenase n=1 Tax=unclassified Cohnella TaxID=2636738 RepID=UPI000B8BE4B0|nr:MULTISPECIES: shikimate dehydrogenase [unclassified Cohnella]OXS62551.1 shikimate dehydrogenase [Cohnella sp. CIP 111063]PRX74799.1 shikimate dehydrogenase [Cohnella sp. SGD-V74]